MSGGRSGPVGRTVRQYNSCLSREGAALVGLEGRTADGPPLGRGQSAGVLKNSSERLFLWQGLKGRTADGRPRGADSPQVSSEFDQRRLGSLVGFKSEGRTVRPCGADGPPVN